jgi:hypothetical protein
VEYILKSFKKYTILQTGVVVQFLDCSMRDAGSNPTRTMFLYKIVGMPVQIPLGPCFCIKLYKYEDFAK